MTYDFDRLIDRRRTDSQKWKTYGPDVLPLWIADMDFQSPEPVIRALRERVEHGVFGYLALEQPEFHELFADRLLKRYGWRVSADAVVLIPGVIPGFNVAGRVLASPGDGLVLMTPVYPPILRAASSIGLTREEAPLARRADGSYEVDVDAFTAAIGDRTRFFLLCNPHNPVGRVLRRDELQRLAEVCLRRGLAIVADEIHCELAYPGHRHTPIASLDPDRRAHDHAHGAEQDLQPGRAQVLGRDHPERRPAREVHRGARRPRVDGERPRLHGGLRGVPRRRAVARRADAISGNEPRLRHGLRADAPARRAGRDARGDLSGLARLPQCR